MKKILLILLITAGLSRPAFSQDFPYGHISTEDLNMKQYAADTSAHALVLAEYGRSKIGVANDDNIKLTFEYHVKIKIFDAKGFDEATAEIKLRNNADNSASDDVEELTGTTYYVDNSGALQQMALDPSKKFITRDYKYQSTFKFAMPALHNGCIIEYKYRLVTPFYLEHFRPWNFQSDIPKISSEYEAVIPGHFTYNAALRGSLKLSKNKADVLKECFSTHGAASDCSDIIYGMSNIPAFEEEDYMTAAKNYISAIFFDLVEFTDPYNGVKNKATKEWRDIDYLLKTNPDFGSQLKKKDLFKDRLVPVIIGKTDPLDKAKAIYEHLQKWYKWNDYIGYESSDGIKKAFESHTGSVGDINLSLIVALNGAGISTDAMLLSTRENGSVNDLYPAVNDFNYVIARAIIGDKVYLLDATDPLLPFGTLQLKCLNGKGRVFSLDKPSFWSDLDMPQKKKSTLTMDLTLMDNGKLKGTITNYFLGYEAYERRMAIKKFNTFDEYVEDFGSKLPKLKILKSEVTNLDSLDLPLAEKFDVEINVYDKLNTDKLSFNPFFLGKLNTNPFKLASRSYPVDMGMPSDDRIALTVHLPAQYTIESPPPVVSISLPNNGGRFLTDYQADANSFTFSHVTQLNNAVYGPEEYPSLKELYNKIIQSERAEMIFKKKP